MTLNVAQCDELTPICDDLLQHKVAIALFLNFILFFAGLHASPTNKKKKKYSFVLLYWRIETKLWVYLVCQFGKFLWQQTGSNRFICKIATSFFWLWEQQTLQI